MLINQKGIAHILILLVLVAGVIGGLVLIKNPKILAPRAQENQNSDPQSVACKTTLKDLKLEEECKLHEIYASKTPGDGFKKATITCSDGFIQVQNSDGCSSRESWSIITQQVCANHSQCLSDNKQDPKTSLAVTINPNSSANLFFNASAAKGISIVHTAVWPYADSEQTAKSKGEQGALYQGFTNTFFNRVVPVPSYIEYYAVSKPTPFLNENLNKRLIVANPKSIEVVKYDATTKQETKDLEVILAPVAVNSDSFNSLKANFNYLVPGNFKVSYFMPEGYAVYSHEVCGESSSDLCRNITASVAASKDPLPARNGNIEVTVPEAAGSKVTVKLYYSSHRPVSGTPDITCNVTEGKAILKKIPERNVDNIDLRIDNTRSGGWNGNCNSPLPGDACKDRLTLLTPYSFDIEPNQKYNLFYAVNYQGQTTNSKTYAFTCPSPVATCVSANKVRITFAPIVGAEKYGIRLDNTANPWLGYTVKQGSGDIVDDNVPTSKVYDITPEANYSYWYQAINSSGSLFGDVIRGSFVCPKPTIRALSEDQTQGANEANEDDTIIPEIEEN